jgi:hypothetical protein
VDTGDRFASLADAWRTRTDADSWYVFNDAHAVMALVGAGALDEAERLVDALARYVGAASPGSNVAMTAEVGLPVSRAVVRYGQGRYEDVVADLAPIRRVLNHFGGSHAQRDAWARTLLEAALRSNQLDLARALIDERLSLRETSVYGWSERARLERARGNDAAADQAERNSSTYRARFAAARG